MGWNEGLTPAAVQELLTIRHRPTGLASGFEMVWLGLFGLGGVSPGSLCLLPRSGPNRRWGESWTLGWASHIRWGNPSGVGAEKVPGEGPPGATGVGVGVDSTGYTLVVAGM